MIAPSLPEGPLVAWYGDDFTGSAAVMEALSFAGLPSVLFLRPPEPELVARFAGMRGIGIAGTARARPPAWMDAHLPAIFRRVAAIGAPVSHYKICSTFDSAPHLGSIGRAIDLGVPILGGAWHPLLVAAPPMARYQAFGNLFAGTGGTIHRLDRHPTMRRHPATPMHEADVRRHLATQTDRPLGLVDLCDLRSAPAAALARERARGAEVIALDATDEADLAAAGALIWQQRGARLFAIGSQGLEYALIAHWRAAGLLPEAPAPRSAGRAARMMVVSGSCSPETAAQIAFASCRGFRPIRAEARLAADAAAWEAELARLTQVALAALGEGADPLIFTASGPDDPSLAAVNAAIAAAGAAPDAVNERLGQGLGRVLKRVLAESGTRRAVIAGGDTSGHAALALGLDALTALAPTIPGAALCRAHCADTALDAIEIALKGGQMGTPDFFHWIKEGGGPSPNRSEAA